ncbi:hypothetical protein BGX38DRAFT_1157396 [Terfezia claveryi]|nr:hypothetical protein BGX38DRAFT_1157396 [Terfezia claveryi]
MSIHILKNQSYYILIVKVVEWLTRSPAIAMFSKVSGCLLGAQVRILSLTFVFLITRFSYYSFFITCLFALRNPMLQYDPSDSCIIPLNFFLRKWGNMPVKS